MVAVACTMFVFSTFMIALGFSRALDAFIVYRDTIGPVYYYEEISNEWKIITEMIIFLIYSLFADAVLIHRTYLIWGRDWRVVSFNILMWLGSIGLAVSDITLTTRISLEIAIPTLALTDTINNLNTAFLALTLGQNVIMTSMIIFRIWRINSAVSRSGRRTSFMPIIYAMIESASMYALTLLAYLLLAQLQPILQDSMTEVLSGMIGITFMLLIVRAQMANSGKQQYPTTGSHRLQPIGITTVKQTSQWTDGVNQSREYVISRNDETESKGDESV